MAEMPPSKHLVYAIYRLATHPGILRELTPDQWALNRENPNYQKITSTHAHRWVRNGGIHETSLWVGIDGRIRRPMISMISDYEEQRDYYEQLINAANRLGATDIRITHNTGRHKPRIVFRALDGTKRSMFVARPPADRRAYLNDITRIRRLLSDPPKG